MALIVDAYNVLHCSHVLPGRWAMVSAAGLCQMIESSGIAKRAVVVCDGSPKPSEHLSEPLSCVQLRHSGPGVEADLVIERLIEADTAPHSLIVVSNDNRIRRAARRRRAVVMSSEDFLRQLAEALQNSGPVSPEKPNAEHNADLWMRKFGLEESPDDHDEDLASDADRWMRDFGFEPDEEEK